MTLRRSQLTPPLRAPVHFGPISNAEYCPRATPEAERAEAEVLARADGLARRLGRSRREVLAGPLGVALSLQVLNLLGGCKGGRGETGYNVDTDAICAGRETLNPAPFVFDVQTHHVEAVDGAAWTSDPVWRAFFDYLTRQNGCSARDYSCIGQEAFLHEIFVNSQTTVAVLTSPPALQATSVLSDRLIDSTRQFVNELAASQRLLTHSVVLPDQGLAELERMAETAATLGPAGWKVYTPWTPTGGGWWLDDAGIGLPFLDQVRALGPRRVCAHKGLPLSGMSSEHASPRDIGPAAALYPDIDFLVYHSGYELDFTEGPYDPEGGGVDRLIRSLADAGLGPGANVYAELGATWHELMRRPTEAAHVLGKLLLYLGEENILWGTDCVWYGSPQAQIEAFLAFEIGEDLQAAHGYPALTDERRAKILGLNAARVYGVDPAAARCSLAEDGLAARREEARDWALMGPPVYGPRSRRELLAFLRGA